MKVTAPSLLYLSTIFAHPKHRHAKHARVIFFFGGRGGGHCGSNEILCFVEKRN